jgi:F-type H+-transporting ATPase subunit b
MLGFRFALLAMLACAIVGVPHRAAAQEPAPAQTSASQPAMAPPPNAELSEKEEKNVYRHSPMVQSIARMLFRDRDASEAVQEQHNETTAVSFELLNFAIIFFAIVIPLYRILPRVIRGRREKLQADLESARKMTEDANSRLTAVEAKLSHLDEEIASFRAQVEGEIHQDEARIKASLEEESKRVVASAEQEIGVAAAQARRALRNFAAGLAIDQAAQQMVLTPETDRALIAEFVSDMVANGKARGGQN